uniref:hypothetical protein n=1 Tax=Phocaeicola plebeius TaxID=310297 RepID=UPI003568D277
MIKTINDELKDIVQIEHSRHRSFNNFIANSYSYRCITDLFFENSHCHIFVNDGQPFIF